MIKEKNIEKNKKSSLSEKILKEIKDQLLKRKKLLMKEVESLKDAEDTNKDRIKFPDFGDKVDENAQEIGEYSTNLATDQVLESTLRDINNALDRIENGTYGTCKYCQEEIGEKRLLARPVASACIKCKSQLQNNM